jgi:hypothetical protein
MRGFSTAKLTQFYRQMPALIIYLQAQRNRANLRRNIDRSSQYLLVSMERLLGTVFTKGFVTVPSLRARTCINRRERRLALPPGCLMFSD